MIRLMAFLLLLATIPGWTSFAEGAGGLEITQSFAAGDATSAERWTGIGGFGYGVLRDGSVIGGFGMGAHSPSLSAGYGGTLQGWQHRWGPLVGLATTKIGFGGVATPNYSGFSMLGAAEAQLGILVLPWFDVGFKAGVAGTVTFVPDQSLKLAWSPVVGVRLAWGAF